MSALKKEDVVRCARMYLTNYDAGQALGITPQAFRRSCIRYGVDPPEKGRSHAAGNVHPISNNRHINYGKAAIEAEKCLALIKQDREARENANREDRKRNSKSRKG